MSKPPSKMTAGKMTAGAWVAIGVAIFVAVTMTTVSRDRDTPAAEPAAASAVAPSE